MKSKILITSLIIMILPMISACNKTEPITKNECDSLITKNRQLEEEIIKLNEEKNTSSIFTFGIPVQIEVSLKGTKFASPYSINPYNKNNMLNGVIELLCEIYHISNKTFLGNYKPDPGLMEKVQDSSCIILTYPYSSAYGSKLVPFSSEETEEVDKLILWYDQKDDALMLSKAVSDNFTTISLKKGGYFTREDLDNLINHFTAINSREIQ